MSATPRLYVDRKLRSGSHIELAEDQAHYLGRVLRLSPGATVRVFNGEDGEFQAEIAEVAKRTVSIAVHSQTRRSMPNPNLWLLFSPIRKSLTDLIVEKSVELGVQKLAPVRTQWTNGPSLRPDRLQKIIVEAAEQTERLDLPELASERTLAEALSDWPEDRELYYCDEAGEAPDEPWGGSLNAAPPMLDVLQAAKRGPAAVLIGPEGGFSPEERADLRARPYVKAVSLGPRILRAETAAMAALTLWQAVFGDWGEKAPEN